MNETLVSIPARLVHRIQNVIGGVRQKVRDGHLIDKAALNFAIEGADDLLQAI
jgi:chromate reductase